MYRYLGVVGLLALAAQGCSSRPANTPKPIPLSSFRVEYQTWSCQKLAEEADLLSDALAVADEQETPDSERVAHIKRERDAVQKQSTLKGCKLGGSSNQ
jgi:hypothetical protein